MASKASKASKIGLKVLRSRLRNPGVQRNAGAKIAKGSILIFIDADIRLVDNTILKEAEEKLTTFAGATARIDVIKQEKTWTDTLFCAPANLAAHLIPRWSGRGAFMAVQKKAFEDIGGFDSKRVVSEDLHFFRRLARKEPVCCLKARVQESPRRYRRYGHTGVLWSWIKNSIVAALTGYSADQEWEAVR